MICIFVPAAASKGGSNIEGRVAISEYSEFILFNVYFPNGKRDETRLKYKMDLYEALFDFAEPLRQEGGDDLPTKWVDSVTFICYNNCK